VTRRALAVALAALATGCGVFGVPVAEVVEVPDDHLIAPRDGPVALVGAGSADGGEWAVHAYRRGGGSCVSSRFPPFGEAGACGMEDNGFEVIALGPEGDTTTLLMGVVPTGITVRLDFAGRTQELQLISLERAGLASNGFAAALPHDGLPERIVALDANDAVLDELVITGP
jgi:hypothetical protein